MNFIIQYCQSVEEVMYMTDKYEIVKFVDGELELEVRTDKEAETVWLTQKNGYFV